MRQILNLQISFFLGLIGFGTIALGQSTTLSLGSGPGTAGGSVVLPITMTSAGGAQTADVEWSFTYSADITGVSVALGSSGVSAQKSLSCNGNMCIVYGLNQTVIANGTVAVATFQIASNPSTQSIPIQITSVSASTGLGGSISASGLSGTVSVPSQSSAVSGMVCTTTTLATPGSTSCTVSLTAAAPAGGYAVPLSSNNASLTVPSSATVGAGQVSASFTATSVQVNANQTAIITAGSGTVKTVTLSLVAPVLLTGITCSPTSLSGGASSTCTVSLSSVTAGAATLSVSSNNAIVTAPGSVTVPAGQSGASFQVTAGTVISNQTAVITAGFNGVTQTATLSLTAPPLPTAVSVAPSASTGTTQIFTFVFADSQSATNLSAAAILFAPSLAAPNSCYVVYDHTQGTVQLEWDNVSGDDAKLVGSSLTLQNSQCMIGATSVTSSTLTNTITMAVTFKGTFNGLKNIYMYGADTTGAINTGWVQKGTYNVTTAAAAPVPTAVSVSPSANAGTTQTFAFVFSDSQSATNLSAAAMLFGSSLASPNSCYVVYDRTQGTVQLEWDNVTGNVAKPVSSTATLQNSQCTIGATTVTSSGLTNTITLAVTFSSAFSGLKNIYMYGADTTGTINTGWVQQGTYNVTTVSAPVPTAVSVSPSAGGGAAQAFSFVFSDSQSATNLSAVAILFAPSLAATNSCYVVYDRNQGTVQLEWDNVTGADEKPISSSLVLQNSQCSIGATTVTTSGLSVTFTAMITFKAPFVGVKNVYMYGADTDGTINTGWVLEGTWTP